MKTARTRTQGDCRKKDVQVEPKCKLKVPGRSVNPLTFNA